MSGGTDQHEKTAEHYTESSYPRSNEESEAESLNTDEEVASHKTTPMSSNESKSMDNEASSDLKTPLLAGENEKDESYGEKIDDMTCGVCFQILMDPISLGCGHSFCELCLAGMWKVNRTPVPLCPMCRVLWGRPGDRLPSVNVMLRYAIMRYQTRLQHITSNYKYLCMISFEICIL